MCKAGQRCIAAGVFLLAFINVVLGDVEVYNEKLQLTALSGGLVHAYFDFTVISSEKSLDEDQYNLMPKALGEILKRYSIHELDVALTQGNWKYSLWGIPQKHSVNPSGAHVLALFKQSESDVNTLWKGLVNSLSGLICASLNFMDEKSTIIPKYTFFPSGAVSSDDKSNNSLFRYAVLAQENVCTENLTPFKKLLPCYGKAGISKLLNSQQLFDSDYFSLYLKVTRECADKDCTNVHLQFKQGVSVVLNTFAKGLRRTQWSMKSLFKTEDMSRCHVASNSDVSIDVPATARFEPAPLTSVVKNSRTLAHYLVHDNMNIQVVNDDVGRVDTTPKPALIAHRYMAGYGLEQGSLICEITNRQEESIQIVYTDVIPWFLRVYLHTLKVETNGTAIKPVKIHYEPGLDRKRPYLIELLINLPANSKTIMRYDVDKLFLRWTEYPPDANLGFYIPSSIITAVIPDASPNQSIQMIKEDYGVVRLYTEKILVNLPTPDFSMPYNVICLACTVVAIAFGSFHNISTKIFLRDKPQSIREKFVNKLKSLFTKEIKSTDTSKEESTSSNESVKENQDASN